MVITNSNAQGREILVSLDTAMPSCASMVAPELAILPKSGDCEEAAGNTGSHTLEMIYPPVQVSEYEYNEIVGQVKEFCSTFAYLISYEDTFVQDFNLTSCQDHRSQRCPHSKLEYAPIAMAQSRATFHAMPGRRRPRHNRMAP